MVRNGRYEAVDRKSFRFVSQGVSYLRRATTPNLVNISDAFSKKEFSSALPQLKPGKAPGLDSIFPDFILIHAGDALKSCLRDVHSSCLRRLKNSQDLEKSACSSSFKADEAHGGPNELLTVYLFCVP